MMCENPFIKTPMEVDLVQVCGNENYRQAATPHPCGRCLPCRVNKKRVWVTRNLLEAMCYDHNTFTTLTYSDENLPEELKRKHLTEYIKKLRRIRRIPTRYFGVGEYGTKSGRPHYHLLLFGLEQNLAKEYTDKAWNKGFHYHGTVTKESVEYVTGYMAKGWNYERNPKLEGRAKEFASQSRRNPGGVGLPGIQEVARKIIASGFDYSIIRQLRFGGKNYPLGRYLTGKLVELLGITEDEWNDEILKHQLDIIVEGKKKGGIYKEAIVNEKSQQRLQQKKRLEIYKKKEQL